MAQRAEGPDHAGDLTKTRIAAEKLISAEAGNSDLQTSMGSYLADEIAVDPIGSGLVHGIKQAFKISSKIFLFDQNGPLPGIDAWRPTESRLTNFLLKHIDAFISISDFTRDKFLAWAKLDSTKGFLLPNAIDISDYGPGPKNPALVDRYNLHKKTVLMTLGRLVSHERYKGFDEVIDILPDLIKEVPAIVYMIAGDGDDRSRLEEKAMSLGLTDRIIFTGLIPEAEKADHYRLADAYVMPSRGEGFGFVFLEAMACGIPVVASQSDGSREAVRNGSLGLLVNPADKRELKKAILEALNRPNGTIPEGLAYFSFDNFSDRLSKIIEQIV